MHIGKQAAHHHDDNDCGYVKKTLARAMSSTVIRPLPKRIALGGIGSSYRPVIP